MATDLLKEAVEATIAGHPEEVERWMDVKPKAWGYLAGKAVVAYRDRLGRPLTEAERRLVWHRLWQRLEEMRQG